MALPACVPARLVRTGRLGGHGRVQSPRQWRRDGTLLAGGGTLPSLRLTGVGPDTAGKYACRITNADGVVWSWASQVELVGEAQPSDGIRFERPIPGSRFVAGAPSLELGADKPESLMVGVQGSLKSTYILESSSDMRDWAPMETNRAPFVYRAFRNPTTAFEFYRARSGP